MLFLLLLLTSIFAFEKVIINDDCYYLRPSGRSITTQNLTEPECLNYCIADSLANYCHYNNSTCTKLTDMELTDNKDHKKYGTVYKREEALTRYYSQLCIVHTNRKDCFKNSNGMCKWNKGYVPYNYYSYHNGYCGRIGC